MGRRVFNFDAELELKGAGLVAASAAALVDNAAKIIDLGVGRFEGIVVFDLTAVEIASNDELYTALVQGSSSATFASDVQNLAQLDFGATEVRLGSAIDSLVGRYELAFTNEQKDLQYRYLRLWTVVAGSIATGINYTAFVSRGWRF